MSWIEMAQPLKICHDDCSINIIAESVPREDSRHVFYRTRTLLSALAAGAGVRVNLRPIVLPLQPRQPMLQLADPLLARVLWKIGGGDDGERGARLLDGFGVIARAMLVEFCQLDERIHLARVRRAAPQLNRR